MYRVFGIKNKLNVAIYYPAIELHIKLELTEKKLSWQHCVDQGSAQQRRAEGEG